MTGLLLAALLMPCPIAEVPAPALLVQEQPLKTPASDPLGYAARERASRDLEEFTGGSEGLVVLIVVVVAILVLIAIILPW